MDGSKKIYGFFTIFFFFGLAFLFSLLGKNFEGPFYIAFFLGLVAIVVSIYSWGEEKKLWGTLKERDRFLQQLEEEKQYFMGKPLKDGQYLRSLHYSISCTKTESSLLIFSTTKSEYPAIKNCFVGTSPGGLDSIFKLENVIDVRLKINGKLENWSSISGQIKEVTCIFALKKNEFAEFVIYRGKPIF